MTAGLGNYPRRIRAPYKGQKQEKSCGKTKKPAISSSIHDPIFPYINLVLNVGVFQSDLTTAQRGNNQLTDLDQGPSSGRAPSPTASMTSSTADSSSGAGSSRSRVGKVINHGSESKLHQLIPTTKLIRKSQNLYVIFSCRLGSTHSKIDDLFIYPPPPKYSFRFISLVGYTLYLKLKLFLLLICQARDINNMNIRNLISNKQATHYQKKEGLPDYSFEVIESGI